MACTSTSVLPTLAVHGLVNAGLPARWSSRSVSVPPFPRRLGSPYLSTTFSTSPESGTGSRVVVMATGETSTDPVKPVTDALQPIQEAWEKTDDKLAVGGLGFAVVIVLWALTGLIAAIDKLPLIPNAFEFVGILFSGWFIYRYLLFKPDREELWKKFQDTVSNITGQ